MKRSPSGAGPLRVALVAYPNTSSGRERSSACAWARFTARAQAAAS